MADENAKVCVCVCERVGERVRVREREREAVTGFTLKGHFDMFRYI